MCCVRLVVLAALHVHAHTTSATADPYVIEALVEVEKNTLQFGALALTCEIGLCEGVPVALSMLQKRAQYLSKNDSRETLGSAASGTVTLLLTAMLVMAMLTVIVCVGLTLTQEAKPSPSPKYRRSDTPTFTSMSEESLTGSLPSSAVDLRRPPPSVTATGSVASRLPNVYEKAVAVVRDKPTMGPKPVCPALILHSTEARFMIKNDRLDNFAEEIPVLGTSGKVLLHMQMTKQYPETRLSISSVGCPDEPRATVVSSPNQGSDIHILRRDNIFYGVLRFPPGSNSVRLECDGAVVMIVELQNANTRSMTMYDMSQQTMATADRLDDYWTLQVKPAVDAVLIMSCALGIMLLRPWPGSIRR
mmetsp:Transcript_31248/g.83154  ORF Transcript_31248/g.83154 Transcript_31248/m.83154 type:complete len:361 (-) Transcript_31248:350-1432(-)